MIDIKGNITDFGDPQDHEAWNARIEKLKADLEAAHGPGVLRATIWNDASVVNDFGQDLKYVWELKGTEYA